MFDSHTSRLYKCMVWCKNSCLIVLSRITSHHCHMLPSRIVLRTRIQWKWFQIMPISKHKSLLNASSKPKQLIFTCRCRHHFVHLPYISCVLSNSRLCTAKYSSFVRTCVCTPGQVTRIVCRFAFASVQQSVPILETDFLVGLNAIHLRRGNTATLYDQTRGRSVNWIFLGFQLYCGNIMFGMTICVHKLQARWASKRCGDAWPELREQAPDPIESDDPGVAHQHASKVPTASCMRGSVLKPGTQTNRACSKSKVFILYRCHEYQWSKNRAEGFSLGCEREVVCRLKAWLVIGGGR